MHLQHSLHDLPQRRQVDMYRIPNSFEVDTEITMDQFVPHTCNVPPGGFRITPTEGSWYVFGCFSNYLKRPNDSIHLFIVIPELLKSEPVYKPGRFFGSIPNIVQIVCR